MSKVTEWQERVSAYKASGLSRSEYCRGEGIAESTLSYWQTRLKRAAPGSFVRVGANLKEDRIEVVFPGNVIVRIPCEMSAERIKELVEALRC